MESEYHSIYLSLVLGRLLVFPSTRLKASNLAYFLLFIVFVLSLLELIIVLDLPSANWNF